jgi:hypothetical protein
MRFLAEDEMFFGKSDGLLAGANGFSMCRATGFGRELI